MGETNAIVKAIEAALASLHPVTSAIFTGVATYRGEKEMRFVKDVKCQRTNARGTGLRHERSMMSEV